MADPNWVRLYLRIPWVEDGRTHEGADCWGLVRLVLAEVAGIEVSEIPGAAAAALASAENEVASGCWHAVEWRTQRLQRWDVPLYFPFGHLHCGVMLDHRRFLSTRMNEVSPNVDDQFVPQVRRKLFDGVKLEVYRHASAAGSRAA